MNEKSYFQWLSEETNTKWWNDSGLTEDIALALRHGAVGVTTNPVLSSVALKTNKDLWISEIREALGKSENPKAVELTGVVVKKAAAMLSQVYQSSGKIDGYVCSQVSPMDISNRESMLKTALIMKDFAPNVSVKLPATAAGLDIMEELVQQGISVTMTVSFTVPQVLAIAERARKAEKTAKAKGIKPGNTYAVVMIGRLDDYLRDAAADCGADVSEDDITKAGLTVVKRAYGIYMSEGYSTELMIAAMRGNYHITELAGGSLILSVHPKFQGLFLTPDPVKEERIDAEVDKKHIEKLLTLNEFRRAYEPDGMKPEEFLTFGAEQRTLTQFAECGWKLLDGFTLD